MQSLGSFWQGGRLGDLELASLHSFVVLGHTVVVYSYEPLLNLPPAVERRDAAELLPSRQIAVHAETGSPALHSDLLRYAMMSKTDHVWVDLDIVALRPLQFERPHVFAYETPRQINGAVLRLPPGSRALKRLLRLRPDSRGCPPYWSLRRRLRTWWQTRGRGIPIEDWPWGGAGPRALTHVLKRTGEIRHALPAASFYPVSFEDRRQLLEPGLGPDSFGPDTFAVHLWAKELRRLVMSEHGGQPPSGSFLAWAIDRARRDGFIPS